jgi:hypothetical protein
LARITNLLSRWRGGRKRIEEAEEAHEISALDDQGADLGRLEGDEIRIDTPSTEAAVELIDLLRKHGVACDLRRPHSSTVEVVVPDSVPIGDVMDSTVPGVELWLLLEATPDEVELRCGGESVVVRRPSIEGLKVEHAGADI